MASAPIFYMLFMPFLPLCTVYQHCSLAFEDVHVHHPLSAIGCSFFIFLCHVSDSDDMEKTNSLSL